MSPSQAAMTRVATQLPIRLPNARAMPMNQSTESTSTRPIVGTAGGLIWATGHYRNGILLADVTADAVVSVITGDGLPEWAAPCDPARFAGVPA